MLRRRCCPVVTCAHLILCVVSFPYCHFGKDKNTLARQHQTENGKRKTPAITLLQRFPWGAGQRNPRNAIPLSDLAETPIRLWCMEASASRKLNACVTETTLAGAGSVHNTNKKILVASASPHHNALSY